MSTSPFGLKAGCRQEAQLGVAKCSAGSLSEMSSRARHTPRNSLGELVPFMEVVGIYGEVARVSRARFVWACTIGKDKGCLKICIFRGCRVWGKITIEGQRVKPGS